MSKEPEVPPTQKTVVAPIVANKHQLAASAFSPENPRGPVLDRET
jgi:hypothetical protein